nr:caspase family protein [Frankia sp. CIT1]
MRGLASPGTRVLLVGTGKHQPGSRLPDVPAVTATVADLARALVDSCGVPETGVQTLIDPSDPLVFDRMLTEAAQQASDVLVLYYVGHGLLDDDGGLYLATSASTDLTQPPAAYFQALPYRQIRDTLSDSRARTVVVVLDCCFSGRASTAVVTGSDDVYATGVRHSYLLTAATRDEAALALPGQPHTVFTGALLDLLTSGDPTGPPWLTLDHAYRYLTRTLRAASRPEPHCHTGGQAGDLVLCANTAYHPPAPAGPTRGPGMVRRLRRRARSVPTGGWKPTASTTPGSSSAGNSSRPPCSTGSPTGSATPASWSWWVLPARVSPRCCAPVCSLASQLAGSRSPVRGRGRPCC